MKKKQFFQYCALIVFAIIGLVTTMRMFGPIEVNRDSIIAMLFTNRDKLEVEETLLARNMAEKQLAQGFLEHRIQMLSEELAVAEATKRASQMVDSPDLSRAEDASANIGRQDSLTGLSQLQRNVRAFSSKVVPECRDFGVCDEFGLDLGLPLEDLEIVKHLHQIRPSSIVSDFPNVLYLLNDSFKRHRVGEQSGNTRIGSGRHRSIARDMLRNAVNEAIRAN